MGLVLSAMHMFMLGLNGWSAGQSGGDTPITEGAVTGLSIGEADWGTSIEPPCSMDCCACAEAPLASRNTKLITNAGLLRNLGMSFSLRVLLGPHGPPSELLEH